MADGARERVAAVLAAAEDCAADEGVALVLGRELRISDLRALLAASAPVPDAGGGDGALGREVREVVHRTLATTHRRTEAKENNGTVVYCACGERFDGGDNPMPWPQTLDRAWQEHADEALAAELADLLPVSGTARGGGLPKWHKSLSAAVADWEGRRIGAPFSAIVGDVRAALASYLARPAAPPVPDADGGASAFMAWMAAPCPACGYRNGIHREHPKPLNGSYCEATHCARKPTPPAAPPVPDDAPMPQDAFDEAIKVCDNRGAVDAIEFAYSAGLAARRPAGVDRGALAAAVAVYMHAGASCGYDGKDRCPIYDDAEAAVDRVWPALAPLLGVTGGASDG